MSRVPLLVCGTALRGDDGAALEAARSLPEPARSLADVHVVGQLDADLLVDPRIAACVVADTVVGIPAGTLIEMPLADLASVGIGAIPHSSHALGIGRAVGLAQVVLGHQVEGRFVGIGGVEFGTDAPLSAAVRAALPSFRAAIAAAVADVAGA